MGKQAPSRTRDLPVTAGLRMVISVQWARTPIGHWASLSERGAQDARSLQLRKSRWKRRKGQTDSGVRKPTRNMTETQRAHAPQEFPTLWGAQ